MAQTKLSDFQGTKETQDNPRAGPASKLIAESPAQSGKPKNKPKNRPKNKGLIAEGAMDTLLNSQDSIRWNKSHRHLFLYSYEGAQPTRGADKLARIGRYKTIPQARYDFPEYKAIVQTLPKCLKIWIKHPEGIKTVQQLIEARKTAREVSNTLARKFGLANLRERTAGFSEHTIEQIHLDRSIRPIVMQEPELAQEKLGLSINNTSHKGKVEWTGRTAKERVMNLENWLDGGIARLMETLEKLEEGQSRQFEALSRIANILGPGKPEEQPKSSEVPDDIYG